MTKILQKFEIKHSGYNCDLQQISAGMLPRMPLCSLRVRAPVTQPASGYPRERPGATGAASRSGAGRQHGRQSKQLVAFKLCL